MAKLVTSNIVGTSSSTTWSQAQSMAYEENHQIWVVLKLECKEQDSLIELSTMGAEIIVDLEQKGQSVINATGLTKLVESVMSEISEDITAQMLVGVVKENVLSVCGKGRVMAYLARNGGVAKLRESFDGVQAVSGDLKQGDIVVLATTQFSEVVGMAEFKQILTQDSEVAEALAPLVHKQGDTSGVAAVVGIVGESEPVVTNEINWWQKIGQPKMPSLAIHTPRKINLWVGGVILVLLVIMIGVGMVRRVNQVAESAFNELNMSVSVKVGESLGAAELNPERSRVLLSQAKSEVEGYLNTDIRDEYREKGNILMATIEATEDQAFKKNDIKLETVVELRVLAEGLISDQMKSDGKGNLVFGDTSDNRIVSMNIADRSRQIVETTSDKIIDLAVNESKLYGLSASVVSEYFWKKDESKKAIEADEFWKEPESIELFAGNVYILDKDQGEIWKYPTLGETFGGRRRWFAVGIAPDLSNVVDMKVVGDIWLLTSTGKLERYSRGAPVNFLMEGFPSKGEGKKLVDPRAVWVSESMVYVLESGAERVVTFGEDGKYRAQYVSSEFARARDLVVVDNKGYVLIDNVVKEFGL